MNTIQVRVDEKTKQSAKKVLDGVGLDMSTAIKLYLKQITIQKGIPFSIVTENLFSIKDEQEILKASIEAKQGKNITKAMSAKQALKHLDLL